MSRNDELPRQLRPSRAGSRTEKVGSIASDLTVQHFYERMVQDAVELGLVSQDKESQDGSMKSGDFVRPFLDACASALHVLSFYQGRTLDEGFLGSAREERSIFEIARMLGVARRPALSSESFCSLTAVEIPGDGKPMLVPDFLPFQSVPIKGGLPQLFESTESIMVHPEWNKMEPSPEGGDVTVRLWGSSRGVVVRGTVAGLAVDSPILIRANVDGERVEVVKTIRRIGRIPRRSLSVVTWDEPLLIGQEDVVLMSPEVMCFGARVPMMGADADDWSSMTLENQLRYSEPVGGSFVRLQPDGDWVRREYPGEVAALFCSSDGQLFAGVLGGGVLRSSDTGTSWQPVNTGLRTADVLCISEDATGSLLVGTRSKGVFRSPDGGRTWNPLQGLSSIVGGWPRVKRVDARLPDTPVRCVLACTDATGSRPHVLAGTDAGVFSFDQSAGQWIPLNEGLPGWEPGSKEALTSVRGISVNTQTGAIFAATDQGLFVAPRLNKPWTPRAVGPSGGGVRCVTIDPAGVVYAGLDSGGLAVSADNGNNWVLVGETAASPMSSRKVVQLLALRDAAAAREWVFAATNDGVWQSIDRGARWTRLTDGLSSQDIAAVCVSETGALHVASPVSGVEDEEWPGFALDENQLTLGKAIPESQGGTVGLIEQRNRDSGETQQSPISVASLTTEPVTQFGKSARVSTLDLDVPLVESEEYDRRTTTVRLGAKSLRLTLAQIVHSEPIEDDSTSLDTIVQARGVLDGMTADRLHLSDLPKASVFIDQALPDFVGRRLGIVGQRARVRFSAPVTLLDASSHRTVEYPIESIFELADWPVETEDGETHWTLQDAVGFVGGVVMPLSAARILAADPDAETVTMIRRAESTIHRSGGTHIDLDRPLDIPLDLGSVLVHGNVIHVHHGSRVEEVLGNGDVTQAQQSFPLLQSPLSWNAVGDDLVPDITIEVSGREWQYIEALELAGPNDLVFTIGIDHAGRTWVHFGDGVHGARLQTGSENIVARMRIGAGKDGNVDQGHIQLMRQRPPMVRRVINLVAASGGVDAENAWDLRVRLPSAIRVGRRVVSKSDFEDKVRQYPGVRYVLAESIWGGDRPILCLTVTTNNAALGYQLTVSDPMYMELQNEAARLGTLGSDIEIHGHRSREFRLSLRVLVRSATDVASLDEEIRTDLLEYFSPENRALMQPVTGSEVMAFVSAYEGVINVTVRLGYADESEEINMPYLPALGGHWSSTQSRVLSAELLTLPAGRLELQIEQEET